MNRYFKLLSVLSTGTILGCGHLSIGSSGEGVVVARDSRALAAPRVQPVERITSPISEVEGLFMKGRSAHGSGQLASAEESYALVLVKQPSHLGALNSMAVIYAQTERTDKAIQLFRRALALAPNASHLHNNLGYALLRAGQLEEAETELKLAYDLDLSSSQTRLNLELLAGAKERSAALTGLVSNAGGAETAATGPQLVAVGKNVYELRDGPVSLHAQAQTATLAAVQMEKPVPRSLEKDAASILAPGILHGVRIEVSNGVGIRHLARRTAERLTPMGVVTARLTNQPRYVQAKTEIQFRAGQKGVADALSEKLPVAVRVVPAKYLGKNVHMRLVLGHDLVGKTFTTWLESSSETPVALAGYEGWRQS